MMLVPDEMINKTAQFLSMIFVPVDSINRIAHVAKSFLLLIRFVVLFTLLGGNAIYKLFKNPACREKKLRKKKADVIIKAAIDNTPMHSSADYTLQSTKKDTEPMTAIPTINNLIDLSIEPDNIHKSSINQLDKPIINHNDTITTSVVMPILAQDQLLKDVKIHVIPLPTMQPKEIVQQPEEIIPFIKEDDEHISSTAATSTTITPPTESNDSKEQFYSDLIKKDNNLMSLSDNLQRIFDEPSTPVPLQKISTDIISSRPASVQHSIEEMITTTTPALTPPHPSSASSRRSSVTTMGGKLQIAVQRISRIGSRHSQTEPQQQQQTIDPSTSSSIKKRNRFSTISKLGRKKSTISTLSDHNQKPELPSVEVPKKASRGIRNTIKRTGKKITSLLTPNRT